jgi:hypothetical protein
MLLGLGALTFIGTLLRFGSLCVLRRAVLLTDRCLSSARSPDTDHSCSFGALCSAGAIIRFGALLRSGRWSLTARSAR